MDFKASSSLSIGMEMEFQLLDKHSLDLAYRAPSILEHYSGDEHVKPEYQENTIEVTSAVCRSGDELQTDVSRRVKNLISTADQFDVKLCGAGTHPFSTALAIITPLPRYLHMKKDEGYLSRTQITYATHVHLGMPCGETAIRVMRELKAYLPLFVAFSAGSPFWRGHDTKFASYRHRILAASRNYGIPPSFGSWDEFSAFFTTMTRANAFHTVNDIHWDIRPRPHLGTLEIRTMDVQPTVAEATALASFVRAVAVYLQQTVSSDRPGYMPAPLHWWLEKENHYQASHLGTAAKFISDSVGNVRDLSAVFDDVVREIEPVARSAGDFHHIQRLRSMTADGLSYVRQRRMYESTGSFTKILSSFVGQLEQEARRPPI